MNNKIQLLDVVALTSDLPQHNLSCGEIGTVVECYPDSVFEVEFVAQDGYTYALIPLRSQALAPNNIFVYVVAPGFVETDMSASILASPRGDAIRGQSPLNRVGKPEEVAAIVAFLASGEADFVTGSIIDVNGASYLRT